LRVSFRKAYDELLARDFFGLRGRDINKMAFINRLNIYTKSQYTHNIKFNREETVLIGKVQMAESWEDVIRITDEIYQYSKNEQFEMMMLDFELSADGEPGIDGEELEDDENGQDMDADGVDSDDSKPADKPQKDKEDSKESKNTDGVDDGDTEDGEDDGQKLNRHKQSHESENDLDNFNPTCETDDNYRDNETTLLDDTCKPYLYLNVPTPNLNDIVTPAKRVHEQLTHHFNDEISWGRLSEETADKWVREFRTKNERYVSLLAKEFEMRKAAKSFSKQKQSDTGDIDVTKLASYRFDDNIFRKVMTVPKGKSHGLILLLDYSGSMTDNMAGSIEQILVLSMFCRKVNIPFHVYSFSNDSSTWYDDNSLDRHNNPRGLSFSRNLNELRLENMQLREYLNSKMSNSEFTRCLRNMVLLKMSYIGGRYNRPVARPPSERMSNTPLTEALIATQALMVQFRKVNNLDITNLVIVHDGDADSNAAYCTDNSGDYRFYCAKSENVFLQDSRYKYQKSLKYSWQTDPSFTGVIDWFGKTTNSKVFGFFLAPDRQQKRAIQHYYHNEDGTSLADMRLDGKTLEADIVAREMYRKLQKEKLLVSKNQGYDSFFMISGGNDLSTDDEDLEIEGTITASKLRNAFMRYNKGKQLNRVLVSKFIQGIAT